MVLESLTARNFQKQRRRTVEFDPLITVIAGKTGSGKTSLLRLLVWVLANRPDGIRFVSHGARAAKGILRLDGHTITRRRGKGVNTYALDGHTFRAFGKAVPEAVAVLGNVGPVNIQRQGDPSWWFHLPGPKLAQELNTIVNLSLIDRTLGTLSQQLRQAKARVSVGEDRLREARERRDALNWVAAADATLRRVEAAAEAARLSRLASSRTDLAVEGWGKALKAAETTSRGLPGAVTVVTAGERAVASRRRADTLAVACQRRYLAENHVRGAAERLAGAERELSEVAKGEACPVCERPMR
jgi:DNA repair exonuclease SbcCD ATPase subunit